MDVVLQHVQTEGKEKTTNFGRVKRMQQDGAVCCADAEKR
jgi:hypothetical protein